MSSQPQTEPAAKAEGRGAAKTLRRIEPGMLVGVWALTILLFSILRPNTFLTTGNWANMLASQASLLVLTLGLSIPLVADMYDVSVGSTAGFAAMVLAVLNVKEHVPLGLAMLIAILTVALTGLASGVITVFFGIESLIVTLAMSSILSGATLWISDSNTVTGISRTLSDWTITNRLFGIPLEFYMGVVLVALAWAFLEHTATGRRLLVVGRGREVARLAGMRVSALRVGSFVASAVFAGLAGLLIAGTSGSADPSNSLTLTLPAFAGAFLATTTIRPGRFNAIGVFVAVYFLVTGVTGLQLLGAQTFIQDLFYGGVLIVAVVFSQLTRGRSTLNEVV